MPVRWAQIPQPDRRVAKGFDLWCALRRNPAGLDPVLHVLTKYPVPYGSRQLGRAVIEKRQSASDACVLFHGGRFVQGSLHCDTQTTLRASDAESFAVEKTLSSLVSEFMDARGWKARDMAQHVQRFPGGEKVRRQHIESVLAGDVKMPRYLSALAKAMETNTDGLLAGHIKPHESVKLSARENVVYLTAEDHQSAQYMPAAEVVIPQFETGGSMGFSGLVLQDQPGEIRGWSVTPEWVQKNVHNFTSLKNLAIVTGFGDSMRPLYNPGDPLLVDRGVTTVDFDGIYFFRVGEEGFVKRLQRIPGNGLLVISENKSYRDWSVTKGMDFEVFARVVKVWRGEEF